MEGDSAKWVVAVELMNRTKREEIAARSEFCTII
jgi:hypothetical protein